MGSPALIHLHLSDHRRVCWSWQCRLILCVEFACASLTHCISTLHNLDEEPSSSAPTSLASDCQSAVEKDWKLGHVLGRSSRNSVVSVAVSYPCRLKRGYSMLNRRVSQSISLHAAVTPSHFADFPLAFSCESSRGLAPSAREVFRVAVLRAT
ncbi:hypothetical protein VTK56DRAFT_5181 [Thermocarpiscus australiensis]